MPQLLTVRVTRPHGRPIRIWLPILPLMILLSPIVVLILLVTAAACLVYRVSLIRALGAGWRLLSAIPGTQIDISEARTSVHVTIR